MGTHDDVHRIIDRVKADTLVKHMIRADESSMTLNLLKDFSTEDLARAVVLALTGLAECVFLLGAQVDKLRVAIQELQDDSTTSKKVN